MCRICKALKESSESRGSRAAQTPCRSTPTSEDEDGQRGRDEQGRSCQARTSRLVEGLRGQAFRIAQQIDISVLVSTAGPNTLPKLFNDNLKPRKEQEARELYATVRLREGGMLSRQHGESMSSYVARRRAWRTALQGLDQELKIPDIILAEQALTNCGLSDDQKLMVRTMLLGRITTDTVAAELLSQHPHLHDKEIRQGRHQGSKSWRFQPRWPWILQ